MTNPHLDQARAWAEYATKMGTSRDDARAAIDLIQSLPDHWIDVEEVREVVNSQLSNYVQGTVGHSVAEDFACKLQSLLDLPLPTLADMTPEEREACLWMQVDLPHHLPGAVLADPGGPDSDPRVMYRDGATFTVKHEDVTPLQGEPKLEWPGDGVVDAEIVEDDEPALPRPEDVPAGEPWKVLRDGHEWVGTREESRDNIYPWALARFDGADCGMANDVDITLVSRLVPEVTP